MEGTVFDLNRSAGREGTERQLVAVPIASLLPADSPRLKGEDAKHVARLAELDAPLPPILVDRNSMRVIDGMHRLLAASAKGLEFIEVEFFEGSTEEAFLRAVEANVTHGLPLSQEDRRAAAERIVTSHPQMSDRAIARASGLSAKSIAAIRRRQAGAAPQLKARIGRDGKVHPLNNVEGRRRAAELIAEFPQASLREVARRAGISPATVSDVRKRLASGELPVTERQTQAEGAQGAASAAVPTPREEQRSSPYEALREVRRPAGRRSRSQELDAGSLLEKLLRDPSLRHKEAGRQLLRLLQRTAVQHTGLTRLASAVPSHCTEVVVDLAKQYSEMWLGFAQELDERIRSGADSRVPRFPAAGGMCTAPVWNTETT